MVPYLILFIDPLLKQRRIPRELLKRLILLVEDVGQRHQDNHSSKEAYRKHRVGRYLYFRLNCCDSAPNISSPMNHRPRVAH